MKESFTAVIKQSNNWWIGWIEEISGVNCQESTKEELLESLRITLKEALDFNRPLSNLSLWITNYVSRMDSQ